MRRPGLGERGSATILVLGLGALIGVATAAGLVRGVTVVARHRAEAAADLAALAAAQVVIEGAHRACAVAGWVAEANGVTVRRCIVSGDVVDIEVAQTLSVGRLGYWPVVARAKAGPATNLPARRLAGYRPAAAGRQSTGSHVRKETARGAGAGGLHCARLTTGCPVLCSPDERQGARSPPWRSAAHTRHGRQACAGHGSARQGHPETSAGTASRTLAPAS